MLAYIREHEGARPKQVSDDLRLDYELTKKTCKRMEDDRRLDSDGRGPYFAPHPGVPAVPHIPAAGQPPILRDTRQGQLSPDDVRPEQLAAPRNGAQMTEANAQSEIGDRVMLRDTEPPKAGEVSELLTQGEGSVVPDHGRPPNMAWVRWDGQPRRSAERFAGLIKITERNNRQ